MASGHTISTRCRSGESVGAGRPPAQRELAQRARARAANRVPISFDHLSTLPDVRHRCEARIATGGAGEAARYSSVTVLSRKLVTHMWRPSHAIAVGR